MTYLISPNQETLSVQRSVVVKSITVTNTTAGALSMSIYRYKDSGGRVLFTMTVPANSTDQVLFDGMSFPDGFTVVPAATLTYYCIEYD